MERKKRVLNFSPPAIHRKEIKYNADYQLEWAAWIPKLDHYTLEKVDFLSITGDAPKDFITVSEYRAGHRSRRQRQESYIAKVGSKYYPIESITEQLITRLGEIFALCIAESQLRMVDGQVRFMSKYFLDRQNEQLTHGAEIYELCIGKEDYAQLAEKRTEREYFTFQMTCEAIAAALPGQEIRIIKGLVEMLTFDALIGHNDRHPYNWGVIVPLRKSRRPRFSPVYDTARALFWNIPERRVLQMLDDSRQFEKYVAGCLPPVGWDSEPNIDFFRLIGLIWRDFAAYRKNIEKFLDDKLLPECCRMIDAEFARLLSQERRELIKRCLHLRHGNLCRAVRDCTGKEGENNAT